MPSEISWLIDNRVVLIRDYGVYTAEELVAGLDTLKKYLNDGTPPIYIVQDSTELIKYPTTIQSLRALMQPHPHVEHIIFINHPQKPGTRFIANLLTSMSGKAFSNVSSLEEALELLRKIDPALDADPGSVF